MAKSSDEEIREKIGAGDDFHALAMADQAAALKEDIAKVRASKYIPPATEIAGLVFDVKTGELIPAEI
jgi:hypothetical protein